MKIIEDPKYIRRLFWLCSIGYIAALLGRLNYNAAMAEMISTGYITMTQAGLVLTVYFSAYAVGQPVSGILSDRFPARLMLTAGFALSVSANILLALTPPANMVVWIWLLNGFAQSMLWPAVVRLLSGYLSHMQSVRAMVNISPAVAVGTLLAYTLTAGIIAFFPWQTAFWLGAFVMSIVGISCFFGIRSVERHLETCGRIKNKNADKKGGGKKASFLSLFLCAGLPIATVAVIMMGMLRDGITTWAPALLSAQFALDTSWAVLITAVVPLLGIAGVYMCHLINKRWLNNEISTSAVFFGVAAFALGLMVIGSGGFVFAAALVIATGVMHGVNTMLISLVPLYFTDEGRASSMSGFLNAFTYVGSGISGVGVGVLVTSRGWPAVILIWMVVAFVGLLACLLCAGKWRRFVAG